MGLSLGYQTGMPASSIRQFFISDIFTVSKQTCSNNGGHRSTVSKAGATLNDLYDTMTQNWFSNFHCVYTIIQDVHNDFIKDVLTDC